MSWAIGSTTDPAAHTPGTAVRPNGSASSRVATTRPIISISTVSRPSSLEEPGSRSGPR